ncbi:MAG: PAS domain-containing protein [Chthonomonas sp.]|nr:PAS domain-containing protein [Chthonomonas sp.]
MRLFRRQSTGPLGSLKGISGGLETALLLIDRVGNVLFANERAKELFGFESLEGRTILAVTLSHRVERIVRDTAETGEPHTEELGLRTTNDLIVIARAWPNPDQPRQVFLSLRDVTEVRRLERVRQDFVANVSHELKTPLTTIRAMAEVLADVETEDVELRAKYLKQIVSEVDRLTALVDDLLVLGRAESEQARLDPCNLSEVVEEVVVQLMPKALVRGLELEMMAPGPLMVSANAPQLRQVFLNLIDNAINYTVEGAIRVTISESESNEAIVTIQDSGIGIPSEDLPRIFERFYRVDKSRSRSSGGTGLGLSIVKHLVEAHGGSVGVESALHRGSTFVVRLPRVIPAAQGPHQTGS